MKKKFTILLLALCCFFIPTVYAEPIIVWPVDIKEEIINPQEILGRWVAFDNNTSWVICFEENPASGLIKVTLKSPALKLHNAIGELLANDNTFYGQIRTDGTHIYGALLFRDTEGTKLRITISRKKYFDLLLFR